MPLEPMNPEAQAVLDKILVKDPSELTENDVAFLRARRSYVGKKSRKKFSSVFDEEPGNEKKDNESDQKQDGKANDSDQNNDSTPQDPYQGSSNNNEEDSDDDVDEDDVDEDEERK